MGGSWNATTMVILIKQVQPKHINTFKITLVLKVDTYVALPFAHSKKNISKPDKEKHHSTVLVDRCKSNFRHCSKVELIILLNLGIEY